MGSLLVFYNLFQRLVFIIPKVISGGPNYDLYLYGFDLLLLIYFGSQQQYCPGCLYNNVHVLRTGKNLKPIFTSEQNRSLRVSVCVSVCVPECSDVRVSACAYACLGAYPSIYFRVSFRQCTTQT